MKEQETLIAHGSGRVTRTRSGRGSATESTGGEWAYLSPASPKTSATRPSRQAHPPDMSCPGACLNRLFEFMHRFLRPVFQHQSKHIVRERTGSLQTYLSVEASQLSGSSDAAPSLSSCSGSQRQAWHEAVAPVQHMIYVGCWRVQEEEQAALDDEAERRRKRVQAWQEQRTKAQALEEAAAQEAAQKAKGWSLEDDLDEVCLLLPHWFLSLQRAVRQPCGCLDGAPMLAMFLYAWAEPVQ